jgi:hypothetical protein
MRFTPWLKQLFHGRKCEFWASWYHGGVSAAPPYISIKLKPYNRRAVGYEILLNLETLELWNIQRVVVNGNVTHFQDVAIPPEERARIKASVIQLPDRRTHQ